MAYAVYSNGAFGPFFNGAPFTGDRPISTKLAHGLLTNSKLEVMPMSGVMKGPLLVPTPPVYDRLSAETGRPPRKFKWGPVKKLSLSAQLILPYGGQRVFVPSKSGKEDFVSDAIIGG